MGSTVGLDLTHEPINRHPKTALLLDVLDAITRFLRSNSPVWLTQADPTCCIGAVAI